MSEGERGPSQQELDIIPTNIGVLQVHSNRYYLAPERILSDGTVIRNGDYYLEIHVRPIPRQEDESVLSYGKRLRQDVRRSLAEVSRRCLTDKRFRNVHVIGGESHLAKHAEKYGFDVFPILSEGERFRATRFSYLRAWSSSGNPTPSGHRYDAQEAFISREKLLALYPPPPSRPLIQRLIGALRRI